MKKEKKTIVLVDDDKWLIDLYGEKLRLEDFNVFTAHNGKDGFEMILKHKPALVLSDVVMAGGDGFYVLEKVRANPITHDIPVISLTNLSNEQDKDALYKLGTNEYLVKADFTPTQVVEKIRKILDKQARAK
ncbi:MAG: Two component transcriptional regulator, winged helix family [Parcubacteria group bacterium GW2011_GWE2_39_37]|uniref:Two component transcriptional regulator, winged helix family n=1 Tax=Candidatus Falkowbacteria bacterium GW2011_GWF2_39_8 TaxID=1618642 RepID=A0A0G0PWA5_9BACT|nr:MAG: Two component transcriptional regulator, winged helix family [Parcubacteria group bacterium GW2011_GWE2_39_37]KKR32449.1 MAG: Two component transcriptional regulator, winged helix family [Candidatus Falkowbacteria bacterium GW2011_GWF2_39_8]